MKFKLGKDTATHVRVTAIPEDADGYPVVAGLLVGIPVAQVHPDRLAVAATLAFQPCIRCLLYTSPSPRDS